MKISGSAILANAVSKEEVLEVLKRDVYSTSGIWDWSKVQIYPVTRPLMKRGHAEQVKWYTNYYATSSKVLSGRPFK